MKVYLGNRDAAAHQSVVEDGEVTHRVTRVRGKHRTEVNAPDDKSPLEVLADITHPTRGAWAQLTVSGRDEKADTKPPAWVSSDDDTVAQLLAAHYGCEVREFLPEGEKGEFGPGGVIVATAMLGLLAFMLFLTTRLNLRTNAGADHQAAVMATTSTQPAAANYLALSTSATAPSTSSTSLGSELTTTGLARKQATYAHTTGTNIYTLTATFTAVSADVAGGTVTIKKFGVLNASSAGTIVFETAVTDAAIAAVGDSVTVTETVTL